MTTELVGKKSRDVLHKQKAVVSGSLDIALTFKVVMLTEC